VLRESAWLREHGVRATLFCGGGRYTDAGVASACAAIGYVDCTERPARPGYLSGEDRWAQLSSPAWLTTGGGRALAIPTTRSIGELARAVLRPSGLPEDVVHVYLHDTDLLDGRRRTVLAGGLVALARRRRATDLDTLATAIGPTAPEIAWDAVARGGVPPAPPVESARAGQGPA
jgi:hypothetical protein